MSYRQIKDYFSSNNSFKLYYCSVIKKGIKSKAIDKFIDIFKSLVHRGGDLYQMFFPDSKYIPSDSLRAKGAIAQGLPFAGASHTKKQKLTKIFFVQNNYIVKKNN